MSPRKLFAVVSLAAQSQQKDSAHDLMVHTQTRNESNQLQKKCLSQKETRNLQRASFSHVPAVETPLCASSTWDCS